MAESFFSKKERTRFENAALLMEAAKSELCPRIGRARCLSCGSTFGSLTSLASHLKKHDGRNMVDYRPANVVWSTNGDLERSSRERPSFAPIAHAVESAVANEIPSKRNGDSATRKSLPGDRKKTGPDKFHIDFRASKKKPKMSSMKKSILIHQVLSLTQSVCRYQQEKQSLLLRSTLCTDYDILSEMKKQEKRLHGYINANKTELDMALKSINQKLTVRQLVMIEYLTNQSALLTLFPEQPVEGMSINNATISTNYDQPGDGDRVMDTRLLELYIEAEKLELYLEHQRLYVWNKQVNAESVKVIQTRRDPETGKIYIQRPIFALATKKTVSTTEETASEGNTEITTAEAIETKDDSENDQQFLLVSSQDTISNDEELGGFSDVLAQWAKQTQLNERSSLSKSPSPYFHPELADLETHAPTPRPPPPASTSDTDIHIIHRKLSSKTEMHSTQNDEEVEYEWMDDSQAQRRAICIFIRPCFGVTERIDATHGIHPPNTSIVHKSMLNQPTATNTHPITTVNDSRLSAMKADGGSVDDAVFSLLARLNNLQHSDMKANPQKITPKWMVSGFSEVRKHISRGNVKLLIFATNIDPCIQSDILQVRSAAEERAIPWICALTRKKMGQIYHYRKRMSMIAVLRYEGLEDEVSDVLSRVAQSLETSSAPLLSQ